MAVKRQQKPKTVTKEAAPAKAPEPTEGDLLEQVLMNTKKEMDKVKSAMTETGRPMMVDELVAQRRVIIEIMKNVMVVGKHYGTIPGTDKPSLWQAGAQLLCNVFRIVPDPTHVKEYVGGVGGHLIVSSKTMLYRLSSTEFLGSGEGMSTTMAGKYRYRNANYKCPECGTENIRRSKHEEGYYCWRKIGGCGATFALGEAVIEAQVVGKVEHDNPADFYNTVVKMANKSSLVAAVLNVTAAGDIFTQEYNQDAEDGQGDGIDHGGGRPATGNPKPAPANNNKPAPKNNPAPAGNGKPAPKKDEAELVTSWLNDLDQCTTLDEMRDKFTALPHKEVTLPAQRDRLTKGKDKIKAKLVAMNKQMPSDPGEAVKSAIAHMDTPTTVEGLDEMWNTDLKQLRDNLKGGPFEKPLMEAYKDRYKVLSGQGSLPW